MRPLPERPYIPPSTYRACVYVLGAPAYLEHVLLKIWQSYVKDRAMKHIALHLGRGWSAKRVLGTANGGGATGILSRRERRDSPRSSCQHHPCWAAARRLECIKRLLSSLRSQSSDAAGACDCLALMPRNMSNVFASKPLGVVATFD